VPLPTPGAAQASQPPPAAAVPAAAPPAYTPPPAAQQAAAPAVDRTALDEQRKRVIQMAQRIATAKAALQSLRESMAQQGLRPRAELQGSAQRMQFEMDQADAALNSGDAGKARQHLDYAERALEALEKALNL
jgi:molecular chaperone GrpE (heat shock protein)